MQGVVGRLPRESLQAVGVLGRAATFHAGELPAGVSVCERIRWPGRGRVAVGDVNGREVGLDLARDWTRHLGYGSIFGSWSIKVVNELDRASKESQDLLLTYLDKLRPGRAFIGTSNLQLDLLTERFQTRFQAWKIAAPDAAEIAAWLVRRWKAPKPLAHEIALGCGGCVRAALADLESAYDMGAVA